MLSASPNKITVDGEVMEVPPITQGAMPWSVFVMLRHIALECERPLINNDHAVGRSAQHLSVVLIFWTLFETLMHGFYRAALADLPGTLSDELLGRFQSIGSRMDRLHKRIWGTTYWTDLEVHGHGETATFLRLLQLKRNAFVHGDPEAIDDELVEQTLGMMEPIQVSWITLFNVRCTRRQRRIPLWHG